MRRELLIAVALSSAVISFVVSSELGCGATDCRSGSDDCIVASPCQDLSFECSGGLVRIQRIAPGDDTPGGLDALSAVGDILIENDQIELVIDSVEHPNFVAASGGAILDLATKDGDNDSINHIFQATGLLPDDAARYTSMEIIDEPGAAVVIVRGHLDGKPKQRIATRYEVRPCEPGVRVRTEYVNLDAEDAIVTLADGWYWSGRGALPFTPIPGIGFEHASFDLTDIQDVYFEVPLMAASGHSERSVAYSTVACSAPFLEGFESNEISAVGTKRRVIPPRSSEVFERFIAVAPGRAVAPAVDVALEVRRQIFGEAWIELSGRVTASAGSLDTTEVRSSIQISRGTSSMSAAERTPLTQALPSSDGSYALRVPRGGPYLVEVSAFGRVVASKDVEADADLAIPEISIAPAGVLTLDATVGGVRRDVLVLVHPADDETEASVSSEFLSNYDACAPLLGPPHGGSPACNRVLVNGPTPVELPPGRFYVYATAGLFATIARETVEIGPGDRQSVRLELRMLPLVPEGALSADFHVHGGASFDSSIPDRDRVRAFFAASMDVIIATDHDVIHDYAGARADLGADEKLIVVTGLETTGQVLFDLVPGSFIPRVIGHYNFWPLEKSPDLPRRGAPYDDKIEPGALFTRMEDGGLPPHGVRQLNHPWAASDFGRDLGFPRAIEVEIDEPLPAVRANSGASLFLAKPPNSRYSNADYHVQEVMNGTNNEAFAADRAFWFYLLDQGIVRGATANSDSHGLTDNVLGTPRTLVFTAATKAAFDLEVFNADVKAGRMLGTNGPIIDVRTTALDGSLRTPSTEAFAPSPGAMLSIRVSAAPWVPVEEIRIIVNGEVVRTLTELVRPADPFGRSELERYQGGVPLAELLPPRGDAWIVVEAGDPLLSNADLDCNGVPDTGDNDGNGVIDWRDAEDNESEPKECDGEIGPLAHAKRPARDTPHFHYDAVTPDGSPAAFTNPLLFDLDGNGFSGAAR